MANEIKVTAGIECTNGYFKSSKAGGSPFNVTQSVLGGDVPGMVSIGTSEEDIPTTDIATLGWCWMKNTSTENYIQYGPKSGGAMVAFGRLYPGEECVFRLEPGITIRAIANTAACKVQIRVYNN